VDENRECLTVLSNGRGPRHCTVNPGMKRRMTLCGGLYMPDINAIKFVKQLRPDAAAGSHYDEERLGYHRVCAMDWADQQAENIIDDFVAYDGPDDLLRLQESIALAIRQASTPAPPG